MRQSPPDGYLHYSLTSLQASQTKNTMVKLSVKSEKDKAKACYMLNKSQWLESLKGLAIIAGPFKAGLKPRLTELTTDKLHRTTRLFGSGIINERCLHCL